MALLAAGRFLPAPYLTAPALQTWATVFVAVCVQALPFLAFGVALSAAITAFVPASFWTRAPPRRTYAAVPVAGVAGAVLPGCECASVPVASGLMARGVAPPAAVRIEIPREWLSSGYACGCLTSPLPGSSTPTEHGWNMQAPRDARRHYR
ncbi:permease [Nonomuraea angiospora]